MAYEKTIWKNREVERPRTYHLQQNEDGTVTLIPAEGAIIEPGTPINAQNMNNIEDGIENLDNTLGIHLSDTIAKVVFIEEPFDQIEKTTVHLGFRPELINIKAVIRHSLYFSIGSKDESTEYAFYHGGSANFDIIANRTVYFMKNSDNYIRGDVVFLDDGFEINWTKAGDIEATGVRRLLIEAYAHRR